MHAHARMHARNRWDDWNAALKEDKPSYKVHTTLPPSCHATKTRRQGSLHRRRILSQRSAVSLAYTHTHTKLCHSKQLGTEILPVAGLDQVCDIGTQNSWCAVVNRNQGLHGQQQLQGDTCRKLSLLQYWYSCSWRRLSRHSPCGREVRARAIKLEGHCKVAGLAHTNA